MPTPLPTSLELPSEIAILMNQLRAIETLLLALQPLRDLLHKPQSDEEQRHSRAPSGSGYRAIRWPSAAASSPAARVTAR